MSNITTVKQGPTGIFVKEGTKNVQVTFSAGEKFISDDVSSQMKKLKDVGVLAIRKATGSEKAKYPTYIVEADTGGEE